MYGANIAGNTKHWRNSATFGRQQSRIANPNSTSLAEMRSPWVSSRGMESETCRAQARSRTRARIRTPRRSLFSTAIITDQSSRRFCSSFSCFQIARAIFIFEEDGSRSKVFVCDVCEYKTLKRRVDGDDSDSDSDSSVSDYEYLH